MLPIPSLSFQSSEQSSAPQQSSQDFGGVTFGAVNVGTPGSNMTVWLIVGVIAFFLYLRYVRRKL